MKKVLAIFPMTYEAIPPFKKYGIKRPKVGDFAELLNNGKLKINALVSGFGCDATHGRIKKAISGCAPDTIMLAGYCGACNPDIKNGSCLLDSRNTSAALKNMALSMGAKDAKIATVARIADNDKKSGLFKAGYDGVEMEAQIVLDAMSDCASKAEFFHIRWVSDFSECKIEQPFFESMMHYDTGEIRISFYNLAKFIIARPSLLKDLIDFRRELNQTYAKYASDITGILNKLEKMP